MRECFSSSQHSTRRTHEVPLFPTLTELVLAFEQDAYRESRFNEVRISSHLEVRPDDDREWASLMASLRQFVAQPAQG